MNVGVIDLGINNLSSVKRAFSEQLKNGDSLSILKSGEEISRPDLIVLPGLGKFGAGISALREFGLIEKIKVWNKQGVKFFGICLGMQLFAISSEESPEIEGLGLLPASVKRLPPDSGEKTPHIGWAETNSKSTTSIFPSLSSGGDFYFVHSFHVVTTNKHHVLAESPFGKSSFVSAIKMNTTLGVQFHPEKSGEIGKQLISETLNWARSES